MNRAVQKYLEQVLVYADCDPEEAPCIRAELEDHLQAKIVELEKQGVSHSEAVFTAIGDLGDPKTVGYGLRKHRWIDIRTQGTARGFIAIGPKAIGTFAIGGIAFGLFACGLLSIGIFSFSTVGIGVLWCYGAAMAFAPFGFAHGSIAIGLAAAGFWSCGLVTIGYECLGLVKDPLSHEPYVHGPFSLVYLLAAMRLYFGIWPSFATGFVAHTLLYTGIIAAGVRAFFRRLGHERRHAAHYAPPRSWVYG